MNFDEKCMMLDNLFYKNVLQESETNNRVKSDIHDPTLHISIYKE